MRRLASLAVLLSAAPLGAQQAPPIQDNSFLIEEAYNQERGVVQHISLFQRGKAGAWAYTFTQEWPFRGQRHQLSYSLPVVRSGSGSSAGLGDVQLNYRYQLVGREDGRVWVAPRLSVAFPTGSWRAGRGRGDWALQLAFPASITLGPRWAAHLNAGLTHAPSARDLAGLRAATTDLNAGASLIFLLRPSLNLMLESVAQDAEEVTGTAATARARSVLLMPGVRWAFNLRNGLQIVPGAGYAFGLGDATDESALLLYLSFEHGFSRADGRL